MQRLTPVVLAVVAIWSVAVAWAQSPVVVLGTPQAAPNLRPTGARPSPRHKLVSAPKHVARADIPSSYLVLPDKLNIYGNDRYGDCVTAEEGFAKACWSVQIGLPELFLDPTVVVDWARAHGYLNGANLTDVMDDMRKDGIKGPDGKYYHDGPYHSVDWTDYATLCSAIYTGPVKLGMAAGQLQNVPGVGSRNGWFATGFRNDQNEDHCTALCGYGTAKDLAALFAAKGVRVDVPPNFPSDAKCVAYYTWGTVGVMDYGSLLATTGEAWVRTPTTAEQPAPNPGPEPKPTPPTPTPNPTPNPPPAVGQIVVDPSRLTVTVPAGWTVNAAAGAVVSVAATVNVGVASAAVKAAN